MISHWIKILNVAAILIQFSGAVLMYMNSPDNTQKGFPGFGDADRGIKISNNKNRKLKYGFLLLVLGLFISLLTAILN